MNFFHFKAISGIPNEPDGERTLGVDALFALPSHSKQLDGAVRAIVEGSCEPGGVIPIVPPV
jgi:hypothetical protein